MFLLNSNENSITTVCMFVLCLYQLNIRLLNNNYYIQYYRCTYLLEEKKIIELEIFLLINMF